MTTPAVFAGTQIPAACLPHAVDIYAPVETTSNEAGREVADPSPPMATAVPCLIISPTSGEDADKWGRNAEKSTHTIYFGADPIVNLDYLLKFNSRFFRVVGWTDHVESDVVWEVRALELPATKIVS